jgi:membrane protein DedA with SNARE-associated domain
MTETIHLLVEKYGLIAVFLGSVAEGESAAILAGFFAHQQIFVPWQAFAAAFLGAFGGDTLFFLAGRRFSETGFVVRLRHRPGFDRAFRLVQEHPAAFVLLNRYAYGFRLVGGVAAGLSGIPLPNFVSLNVLSSAVWALLFCTIGYVFGLGAEQIVGAALHKHERLLIALGIGLMVAVLGWGVAHLSSRRAARRQIF